MNELSLDGIDDAIFACVADRWLKVARIVTSAAEKLGAPDDDACWQAVAARIKALAQGGRVESRGNLDRWGFSEVRFPPATRPCQRLP